MSGLNAATFDHGMSPICLLMVLWPAILVVVENRGLQRLLE